MPKRHLVILDTQIRPGVPLDHLRWIGKYALEKRPDRLIQIGDWADMHSLSSYDMGKKAAEGARYQDDIDAANFGLELLNEPIEQHNRRQRRWKEALYRPTKDETPGNHEDRISRHVESHPYLERKLGMHDLEWGRWGWTVHPYLKPVDLDGILYAHFFTNPLTGKPWGGNIELRLQRIGRSFTMGHEQHKRQGEWYLTDGTRHRGLVSGNCYLHDEKYRGHQANNEWRGIIIKNEVRNGDYDLTEVSLNFLCRKYEGMELSEFMRRGKFIMYGDPIADFRESTLATAA